MKPQNGDYKVKRIFALREREIDERRSVWLQYVYVVCLRAQNAWKEKQVFLNEASAKEGMKMLVERTPIRASKSNLW